MHLNYDALEHAESLIRAGKVVRDSNWQVVHPTDKDRVQAVETMGSDAVVKWYLAEEDPSSRYDLPYLRHLYGDYESVHRSALLDIQEQAKQTDDQELLDAVNKLIIQIDKEADPVTEASMESFPASDPPYWRGRR